MITFFQSDGSQFKPEGQAAVAINASPATVTSFRPGTLLVYRSQPSQQTITTADIDDKFTLTVRNIEAAFYLFFRLKSKTITASTIMPNPIGL